MKGFLINKLINKSKVDTEQPGLVTSVANLFFV